MGKYIKTNLSVFFYNIVAPLHYKNWPIYAIILLIFATSRFMDILAINFLGNDSMLGVSIAGIINFLLVFIIPFSILFMVASLEHQEFNNIKLITRNILKPFKYISSFFVILFSFTLALSVLRFAYTMYTPFQEVGIFFTELFGYIIEENNEISSESTGAIASFIQSSDANLLLFNQNIVANLSSPMFWVVLFLSGLLLFIAFILPIIFYFNKYYNKEIEGHAQKNIKDRIINVSKKFKNQLLVVKLSFITLIGCLLLITQLNFVIVNLFFMLYALLFTSYMIVNIISVNTGNIDENIILEDIDEDFHNKRAANDE